MMTTDDLWNAHVDEMLYAHTMAFRDAFQDEVPALGLSESQVNDFYMRVVNKANSAVRRIRTMEQEI